MGAPKAPTIVQQMAQPTADEKAAAAAALQQKTAALTSINQDVFARSQGLRGAASMYDWAGPTPFLAGPHVPAAAPPPAAKPSDPDQLPFNPWAGPNRGRTTIGPVNDFAHNPFPANPDPSRGPVGDRDPGSRTIGGAPKNTGAVPGGPLLNRPYGGNLAESGLTREQNLTNLGAGGRQPQAYAPAGPKGDRYAIQPGGRPADSYLKPMPNIPKPGTGILGLAQHPLYPVGQANAPKNVATAEPGAPAPRTLVQQTGPAAQMPRTTAQTPAAQTIKTSIQPASTPAPKAPATTAAKPPQPLQAPAPTVTTKPTSAPAPAATLGGVAKPVVYANPNLKTVAPAPKTSIFTTVQHGAGGNR